MPTCQLVCHSRRLDRVCQLTRLDTTWFFSPNQKLNRIHLPITKSSPASFCDALQRTPLVADPFCMMIMPKQPNIPFQPFGPFPAWGFGCSGSRCLACARATCCTAQRTNRLPRGSLCTLCNVASAPEPRHHCVSLLPARSALAASHVLLEQRLSPSCCTPSRSHSYLHSAQTWQIRSGIC